MIRRAAALPARPRDPGRVRDQRAPQRDPQLTVYAGWPLFPSAAYDAAYFAMVVAFYGPVAYWLVKRDDTGRAAP
ncbi:MAG TPA: hypothetical protein VF516_18610 [Kofleriaceae bacterium]